MTNNTQNGFFKLTKFEFTAIAIIMISPLLFSWSMYFQGLLIIVMLWIILGLSWNLMAGYTGQVSFGHAAFFGIGAYAAALPYFHWRISPWWGLITGPIVAVAFGYFLGKLVFKLKGPYFALGTLASGEILRIIFGEEELITNGHNGIFYMTTWTSKLPYFYIAAALAIFSILIIRKIIQSKLGFYFLSIREDQDAAEALGIDTVKYKNLSLAISAAMAGVAGAFYMIYMGFIDPEVVFALHNISIITILVGIIGGVGTIWGPAVGAIVMIFIQELFRSSLFGLGPEWLSRLHSLVFGALVVLIILYMAGGIVGDWPIIANKIKSWKNKTEGQS